MRISNHKPVNRCSEFTLLQSLLASEFTCLRPLLASDLYLPQTFTCLRPLLASEFTCLRPLLCYKRINAMQGCVLNNIFIITLTYLISYFII